MHLREKVTQPADTSYRIIPLTQGKFALVDSEDFEFLSQWNWSVDGHYASRHARRPGNAKGGRIRMHRVILGEPSGFEVDHKNHDTLDNRRSNLRVATSSQNRANTVRRTDNKSGFKGVSPFQGKWRATIRENGKHKHLGRFSTTEEAHQAYCAAATRIYGEFANFGGTPETSAHAAGQVERVSRGVYRLPESATENKSASINEK